MRWNLRLSTAALLILGLLLSAGIFAVAQPRPQPNPQEFFNTYCITCHNQKLRTAGLALDTLDASKPSANPEIWERVIVKLRAGSMPPSGLPRADAATYRAVASALENDID